MSVPTNTHKCSFSKTVPVDLFIASLPEAERNSFCRVYLGLYSHRQHNSTYYNMIIRHGVAPTRHDSELAWCIVRQWDMEWHACSEPARKEQVSMITARQHACMGIPCIYLQGKFNGTDCTFLAHAITSWRSWRFDKLARSERGDNDNQRTGNVSKWR